MGLLVTFIAGGVLQDLQSMSDPSDWISTLGENVPRNSTFFVNYIMFSGLLGLGVEISQVVKIGKSIILGDSKRPEFELWIYYPVTIMYFTITLTYISIAPIILVPASVYFFLAYFIYLYLLLYVYKIPYENGCKVFPKNICSSVCWFMDISIGPMGIFTLKEAYYQGPFMIFTL
eukprot:UN24508